MCVWSRDSPSMAVHSGHLNFFRGVTYIEAEQTRQLTSADKASAAQTEANRLSSPSKQLSNILQELLSSTMYENMAEFSSVELVRKDVWVHLVSPP